MIACSAYYFGSEFAGDAQRLPVPKLPEADLPRAKAPSPEFCIFVAAFASFQLRSGHALREIIRS